MTRKSIMDIPRPAYCLFVSINMEIPVAGCHTEANIWCWANYYEQYFCVSSDACIFLIMWN